MLHFLSRWRIGPRLNLGFAALLGLVLVTGTVTSIGLMSALRSFEEYRDLARETGLIGRLRAEMLSARIGERDFVLSGSAEARAAVDERIDTLKGLVAQAQREIGDAERAAAIVAIDAHLDDYGEAFDDVVDLWAERDRLRVELAERGGDAEAALERVMQAAERDNDAGTAYLGGVALDAVLSLRLHLQQFLIDGTDMQRAAAAASGEAARDAGRRLLRALANRQQRELAQAAIDDVEAFVGRLDAVFAVVARKRELVDGTLDGLGSETTKAVDAAALDIRAEQDALGATAVASARSSLAVAAAAALTTLALGFAISRLLARSINEPMAAMTAAMGALAAGKLDTEVPCRQLSDEMGDMSKAVQIFKDHAVERQRLDDAQRARVVRMDAAIARFDQEVGAALGAFGTASTQLDATAHAMAAAAGQASSNVQAVATAAEEMSASVAEISYQTDTSRAVAGEAVRSVETASRVVHELNGTAQQITDIVDLISDIADQTNLLALNATIEAARAGEAGKGFAVVAHEVKTLAGRTGQATADIGAKITTIRQGSAEAGRMIAEVTQVMARLDEVATAIAGAIEEQTATTASIAQNAQEAAQGTENVVESIRGGERAERWVERSMVAASKQLGEQAEALRARVQAFLE